MGAASRFGGEGIEHAESVATDPEGLSRDCAGFDHGVEDEVTPLHGTLRMAVRIAIAGVLQETGESGALREIELTHRLRDLRGRHLR